MFRPSIRQAHGALLFLGEFLATDNIAALDRAIRGTLRQLAQPRVVRR